MTGDLKDDFKDFLPPVPGKKNGKKIACIGAGCASLTVANDLLPLGYEIDVFESLPKMGGLIRSNIPKFRLPPNVIDEEFDVIVERGDNLHLNHPIESMKELLEEHYDAIFVGRLTPNKVALVIFGWYCGRGAQTGKTARVDNRRWPVERSIARAVCRTSIDCQC